MFSAVVNRCGVAVTHVDGGVERQRTQAETVTGRGGGGRSSGLLQVLVHMEPNPQEAGEFFIFSFFCNSFYFAVIAVAVPGEVGVMQNTRVLPGT